MEKWRKGMRSNIAKNSREDERWKRKGDGEE